MSWLRWSDIWLTQGYALVYPDIPIIGENYNDTYISSLVDAMYGAIRGVDALDVIDIDRVGHGGHSYGAFATANIIARSRARHPAAAPGQIPGGGSGGLLPGSAPPSWERRKWIGSLWPPQRAERG